MRKAALVGFGFSALLAGPLAGDHGKALALGADLDRRIEANAGRMIEWRRYLHAHPELGNREVGTAAYVVARLRELGLEPKTGVAKTGVVALIEGGKPGATVALRADMDALPVTEAVDLPFASRVKAIWEGKEVGVMHACGHDTHTAMLLAAAEALAAIRAELPGRVLLIFQPAEESVPIAEQPAGAELMVAEGVLESPRVEAIFGIHVFAQSPSGQIGYRAGPFLAAADRFEIVVEGRQAHGSRPWSSVDPIVVGSQIVGALQTIVSRQVDITHEPAVVTVGQFDSGVRNNIIPDRARLVGTIRTFDEAMRSDIHARVRHTAEHIAEASGARAVVTIERGYPVTVNDAALTATMLPTLERLAPGRVKEIGKVTGAEDFSFYALKVPALFVSLGVTPAGDLATAASNHSPRFFVDESALPTGARAYAHLALDYLFSTAPQASERRPR